jgi:hypothetical protein
VGEVISDQKLKPQMNTDEHGSEESLLHLC